MLSSKRSYINYLAAQCKGVTSFFKSQELGSAPRSNKSFAICELPLEQAKCNEVLPFVSELFGLAKNVFNRVIIFSIFPYKAEYSRAKLTSFEPEISSAIFCIQNDCYVDRLSNIP